jgi:glycosyltransferase involved in cell wall biosynthesis
MKIFVIGARGFPNVQGGIESHCEELYSRLVKKGFDITALTIKQYTHHSLWNGIRFIRIPTVQYKNLQKPIYNFFSAIYCIFKRPAIVHIHGLNAGLFIWLLKLFGLKIIATYHSMDYIYPKWNIIVKLMLWLSEKQFLLADYIIVVSKLYLEHFERQGRKKNIVFLPNGVSSLQKITNNNYILNRWKLKKGEYILAVGRITPEKDYRTLITAFNKANINSIKLVIVGGYEFQDSYLKDLMEIANENVIFTGYLDKKDLQVLYANCCLFVLPSIYEGLPTVLLEAMSFNCNILVSDIPAHKTIELDPEDYFKVSDPNDLANKMIKKLSQKTKKDYTDLLLKNYNWDTTAEKVGRIYEFIYAC